jgi:hypothetical protein
MNKMMMIAKMKVVVVVMVFMYHCDMLYSPEEDPHSYPVAGISKVRW